MAEKPWLKRAAPKVNRNFNVEILRWDSGESRDGLELLPLGSATQKALAIERILLQFFAATVFEPSFGQFDPVFRSPSPEFIPIG